MALAAGDLALVDALLARGADPSGGARDLPAPLTLAVEQDLERGGVAFTARLAAAGPLDETALLGRANLADAALLHEDLWPRLVAGGIDGCHPVLGEGSIVRRNLARLDALDAAWATCPAWSAEVARAAMSDPDAHPDAASRFVSADAALAVFVEGGRPDLALAALAAGADPSAAALTAALAAEQDDVVDALLPLAPVDGTPANRPLAAAARTGRADHCAALLDRGAHPRWPTEPVFSSPVGVAARAGTAEVLARVLPAASLDRADRRALAALVLARADDDLARVAADAGLRLDPGLQLTHLDTEGVARAITLGARARRRDVRAAMAAGDHPRMGRLAAAGPPGWWWSCRAAPGSDPTCDLARTLRAIGHD